MRHLLILLSALALFLTGCGGVDETSSAGVVEDDAGPDTEAEESSDDDVSEEVDLVVDVADLPVFCDALDQATDVFLARDIVDADAYELLLEHRSVLERQVGAGHPDLVQALDVAVDADNLLDTPVETEAEFNEAVSLTLDYFNASCAGVDFQGASAAATDPDTIGADGQEDEVYEAECPAPEVLEANGAVCDEHGTISYPEMPDPGAFGADGQEDEVYEAECPAPEVLEANGATCDEYGTISYDQQEDDPGGDGYVYEEGYDEPDPSAFGGDGQED